MHGDDSNKKCGAVMLHDCAVEVVGASKHENHFKVGHFSSTGGPKSAGAAARDAEDRRVRPKASIGRGQVLHLAADTPAEMHEWVTSIKASITHLSRNLGQTVSATDRQTDNSPPIAKRSTGNAARRVIAAPTADPRLTPLSPRPPLSPSALFGAATRRPACIGCGAPPW